MSSSGRTVNERTRQTQHSRTPGRDRSCGTVESAARARHLYNPLLKEPDKFWEEWGRSLDEMYVKRAEQSLIELTGQSVEVPNYAELRELILGRATKQREQNERQ